MLEAKGLAAGLIVTLGAFALKAGAGFGYAFAQGKRGQYPKAGIIAIFVYLAFFALVFWGGHEMAKGVCPISGGKLIELLGREGIFIHLFMWAGLMLWGICLLSRDRGGVGSRAWILLSMPCPVCVTVVVLDEYLFSALLPDDVLWALWGPYFFFAFLVVAFAFLSAFLFKKAFFVPEQLLGWIMVILASYFLANLFFAPHFEEAQKVYEMAIKEARLSETGRWGVNYLLLFILVPPFGLGVFMRRKSLNEVINKG